jgi:conjugative relaxase-like TrwC/TraI family protein
MGIHIQPVHSARRIEYLRTALEPDRYLPDEKMPLAAPRCGGKLWGHLGLKEVGMPELRKLATGVHPLTGENLTARRHDRGGTQRRTSFISILFTAPKSVSLMSEVAGDTRLRRCLRDSSETMLQFLEEEYAAIRIRKKAAADRNGSRKTGVLGWVTRLETDSRFSDPHLHVHSEVLNATVDAGDARRPRKALDLYALLRDQRALRRRFDVDLAARVQALGYAIETEPDGCFEIAGVDPLLCERFSTGRRRALQRAREGDAVAAPRPAAITEAANSLRPRKRHRTQAELRSDWLHRVTPAELAALRRMNRHAVVLNSMREETAALLEPASPSRERDPAILPSLG